MTRQYSGILVHRPKKVPDMSQLEWAPGSVEGGWDFRTQESIICSNAKDTQYSLSGMSGTGQPAIPEL